MAESVIVVVLVIVRNMQSANYEEEVLMYANSIPHSARFPDVEEIPMIHQFDSFDSSVTHHQQSV